MGSGGPSTRAIVDAADITRTKGPKRVGPFAVPKAMSSTASATLSTWFKIKGVNYSISSACSTSAHCIGNAAELIQWGKQDMMFAGGCEDLDWTLSVLFDAMGAMSSVSTPRPQRPRAPMTSDRDGFVIAGGGGILVLEELEHAKARGAKIYAEIAGYGADLRRRRHGGAVGRRRGALHAHGARNRARADRLHQSARHLDAGGRYQGNRGHPGRVRRRQSPPISATKSLTGHAGAAGVQEAIYSLLMMQNSFICESANIDNLDPAFADMNIVRQRRDNQQLGAVCPIPSALAAPTPR